ncbi:hypothetical protein PILCRDRAFT_727440 [Piloderma croceum F 1598]|uniref:Uncharacterized protein n=1 Tax=Piloderma croceum (strain F 1598) TaxID=765440 RepID=A0A0C3AI35_PILCF|nr:hypothetical protein PILCRDRAFT_727440 [Piloderma croceum F 1598]
MYARWAVNRDLGSSLWAYNSARTRLSLAQPSSLATQGTTAITYPTDEISRFAPFPFWILVSWFHLGGCPRASLLGERRPGGLFDLFPSLAIVWIRCRRTLGNTPSNSCALPYAVCWHVGERSVRLPIAELCTPFLRLRRFAKISVRIKQLFRIYHYHPSHYTILDLRRLMPNGLQ